MTADLFEQRRRRFLTWADNVVGKIDALLAIADSRREEVIDDKSLRTARSSILDLRSRVQEGRLPKKADRFRTISWMINDHWPLGTKLGNEISEIETFYQNL